MPLDLSDQEDANAELNQFKAHVKEVANKYTERHGWCDVVNQALREIGVEPEGIRAVVDVEIKVQMPVSIADIKDLMGKTPEEQNAIIASKLIADRFVTVPSTQSHGVRYLSTHDVIKPDQLKVVDVNQMAADTLVNGVPAGYVAVFTSDDGRVRHFIQSAWAGERTFSRYGLCGVQIPYPKTTSTRDQGRNCVKCTERARNL